MDRRLAILVEDYDDATSNVVNAKHKFFQQRLEAWFQFLDSQALSSSILDQLERSIDFKKWYGEQLSTIGSMMGSGEMTWPIEQSERLGTHISLLRAISKGEIDWADFAMNFLASDNQYDAMITDIVTQNFMPTSRELRKLLLRAAEKPTVSEQVPASDRIVRRSDNEQAFDSAVLVTEDVISLLGGLNDYDNFEEKSRLIAEIAAGRDLISQAQIRVEAIRSTIWTALKFLAKKTFESALSKLIGVAITLLAALFGFKI